LESERSNLIPLKRFLRLSLARFSLYALFFCPYKKPSFAVQADPFTVWWVKLLADQKVRKGLANRRHTLKSGLFTSSDLPLFPSDVEQASNHSTV
jgi:hypothetical protein